ncbi:bifunctional adenosylcobinamide kinase/adenosylcobinamide-phosphate guanylyltransferase [Niallia sp. 01092]|uniref:bifunctional adenosylcobinamide kinase/adenosylcobinamide-phosphate guanylyltransferase n=1 Tax=unclassified Niallia TaxID=2837522 RepID=UPI003FD22400
MHFITGGSFNGKKRWALNFYQLPIDSEDLEIVCFYEKDRIDVLEQLTEMKRPVLLLEGFEYLIQHKLSTLQEEAFDYFQVLIKRLINWEKDGDNHQVIVIGSDITKGIVPLKKEDRLWRDWTGRIYQEAVRMADRVDVVWYGLNDQLK